jgi:Helicase C-terminal domain/Homing endonuclease
MTAAPKTRVKPRGILSFFKGATPREVQKEVLLSVEAQWEQADVFVIEAPTACHGAGEFVPNDEGQMIKVEDVKEGTLLLGPKGESRKVLETHSGSGKLFRIVPTDGESWVVNEHHILVLDKETKNKSKRRIHVSVHDFLLLPKSVQATCYQVHDRFEGRAQDLPIDPYILGLWLGDGHSADAALTTMDVECKDAWHAWANSLGSKMTKYTKEANKASTYRIVGRPNKGITLLRDLGVLNNKHIPQLYLSASREQRRELLAGLLDSDGHKSPHGGWEITQKRKHLVDEIVQLCESLGLVVGVPKAKFVNEVPYYRIHVHQGQEAVGIPCRLKRKQCSQANVGRSSTRRRFKVEFVGVSAFYGWTVDADNLYLTKNFAITHNSGKSKMMSCIARWAASRKQKSHIAVPNNVLLAQMEQTEKLFTLKSKDSYTCTLLGMNRKVGAPPKTCKDRHAVMNEHCAGCPYVASVRRAFASPFSLSNYHTMMAHKLQKEVVLIDEAHLLLPLIVELESKHIWLPVGEDSRSLLPHSVNTYGKLRDYVTTHADTLIGKAWDTLREELQDGRERYLIKRGERSYHSSSKDALTLIPVDTSHSEKSQQLFPPKKVKKLLLFSGTINEIDVEQLGLAGRRVVTIRCPSPIAVERRPIVPRYLSSPVTFKQCEKPEFLDEMANTILELLERTTSPKVLIHAPYGLADKLKGRLAKVLGSRLLSHEKHDKRGQLETFLSDTREASAEGAQSAHTKEVSSVTEGDLEYKNEVSVLLGSGFEEGLDLSGTQFTMQIICKIPFQSLAEPGWKWVAETNPDRYMWEALKKVVQATGRICRGPQDYGMTYILDSSLERCLQSTLVPAYFREAVVSIEAVE